MTGLRAGQVKDAGTFEPGTVHFKVNKRLGEMTQRLARIVESSRFDEVAPSEVEALAEPPAKP